MLGKFKILLVVALLNLAHVNVFAQCIALVIPMPNSTICSGVAQNRDIYTNTNNNVRVSRAAVSGISNPAVTNQNWSKITETLYNTTNSPVIVTYSIRTNGGCPSSCTNFPGPGCDNTTYIYTVTVNPTPTINSSATGTICSGIAQNYTITSLLSSNYSWSREAVSGISNAAGSGSTGSITETLTNTTNSPIDVTYKITPISKSGNCTGTVFDYVVTVNPMPELTSATTGNVCSGVAQNYGITSSISASYTWSRATVAGISNAEATGSTNTITEILTNTTNSPISVTYNIVPISTFGSCMGPAFNYVVTVNPTPEINSASTGTICSGATQNYTITSLLTSNYSWSRTAVAGIGNSDATGTANTITEILTNSTNAPVQVTYGIIPTSTEANCVGISFDYIVTVNPKPALTSSTTGTVCSGVAQNYGITSSVASSYSWTRAAVAGISNAAGTGTTNTITEILTNTTTAPTTVTYNIIPTTTTGNCVGTAFDYVVTVNPRPVLTSATTGNVCSGVAQNYGITSSVSASYTWSRATVAGISNAAATGSTNTITEILSNTTTTSIPVTYNIVPTSTFGSCTGTAINYVVTVNPAQIINSASTGTICSGAAQNYTITSSLPSNYSWSRTAVAGISNAAATSTTNTITEILTNTTNAPVQVIYSIIPTSTAGNCVGIAFDYIVTVNPRPVLTSATTGTACSGVAQNYMIESSVPVNYNYFYRSAVTGISNATASTFLSIPSSPISETLINTTNAPISVTYLIAIVAQLGNCGGPSFGYVVTVNPAPAITSSTTGSICSGIAQNYTITSSIPSTFSWSRAAVAGISNAAATNTTNSITEILINTTSTPINVTYSISSTSTSGNCNGTTFNYVVTVNPSPVITSAVTGTICSGAAQNYTITSSVSSTYTWSRNTVAGISNVAATSSTNKISEILNNTTLSPIPVTYTITPTSTIGNCMGTALSYVVTVNPTPVINSATTEQLCSGAAQNYVVTSLLPSSYSWSRAVVVGISNSSASGTSSITEALTNTSTLPVNAIYHITPTGSVGNCIGSSMNYTVRVNPIPTNPSVATNLLTYCKSATAPQLTATGSNLLWYTTITGGVGTSVAPTPLTTNFGTTEFYVSQTANSCESSRSVIKVIVGTPPPVVLESVFYCLNVSSPLAVVSSEAGSTLNWYLYPNASSVGSTITPSTTSTGTTPYYVSQTLYGCESTKAVINVIVGATATAIAGPNFGTCENNGAINITNGAFASNGVLSSWSTNHPNPGTFSNETSTTLATYTPSQEDIDRGYVTLTLEVNKTNANGCASNTDSKTLSIYPVSTISGPNAICVGQENLLTLSENVSGGTWQNLSPSFASITVGGKVTGLAPGKAVLGYYFTPSLTTTISCTTTDTISILGVDSLRIASNTPSNSVCDARVLNFDSTGTQDFWWLLNGTTISASDTSNQYTPVSDGFYAVRMTQANGCSYTTPTYSLNMSTNVPLITATGSPLILSSITPSVSPIQKTYQWYANNKQIVGATNQSYTPLYNAEYNIAVSYDGSNTCRLYSNSYVMYNSNMQDLSRMAFYTSASTITIPESVSFKVYPNPTNLNVSVTYSGGTAITINVYNSTGEIILTKSETSNDGNYQLDLPLNVSSGMYEMIISDNGHISNQKIIVIK